MSKKLIYSLFIALNLISLSTGFVIYNLHSALSNFLDPQVVYVEKVQIVEKQTVKVSNHGINEKDVESLIYNVMIYLGESNPKDFTALLLATAKAESDLGQYLQQMRNGPARSIFQIEPETEKEVYRVFLKRNPIWKEKIDALKGVDIFGASNLTYNLAYSTAIAWCVYKWRIPNRKPPAMTDKLMQATYHKKYYNGPGKATIQKTLAKI